MATLTTSFRPSSPLCHPRGSTQFNIRSAKVHFLAGHAATTTTIRSERNVCWRQLSHSSLDIRGRGCFLKPISAVRSGLEASITDLKDSAITVKDAKTVVESQDDEKIQRSVYTALGYDIEKSCIPCVSNGLWAVGNPLLAGQLRVDLTGKETQVVFEKVLRNLARTAPPVPGFRRQKGEFGTSYEVPTDFLLQMLGEERVTSFVIQEIINSTLGDFENLTVKDNKINTTQTAEELKSLFVPGNEFGFNATLELEKTEAEIASSSPSEE
ncbi:hypothetical protein RJ640_018441 [Escallonia rubra]|uniref:peptidylprolyl isomerase n=1 Tax=Escallonia rubra TaxID=112253 RepID=A0AA88RHV8_9ASTE|nr:hypothetical protein RJ640_018441 [Escallonia rubra]